MKSIFMFSILFLIASCGKNSKPNEEIEMVSQFSTLREIDVKIHKSSGKFPWEKEYSEAIIEEINQNSKLSSLLETEINQGDLKRLDCVNFNELSNYEKSVFYTVYIAAIAEAESDFKNGSETMNYKDMTNNVGLLQIDTKSALRHAKNEYGKLTEKDLKNPIVNLKVGLFILKNQITGKVANKRLLPVKSYYWQVLTQNKRFFKNFKMNYSNLSFCKKDEV